jgi:hypothetical protein
VGALLGLGRYGSPAQVWASKVGDGSAFAGNEATAIGTALERRILDAAAGKLGAPILDGAALGQLGDDACERLTCHLDGATLPTGSMAIYAGHGCVGWTDGECEMIPVEAKWTAAVDAPAEYDALEAWLTDPSQPWPEALRYSQVEGYWCQVQAQLAITGAPHGYLVALLGDRAAVCLLAGLPLSEGSLRVCRVPRDEAMIAAIRSAVSGFWASHVEPRVPPAVTDADLDALRRTPRGTLTPEVQADDLADLVAEREACKDRIKAATAVDEARAKEIEATIEARILAAGCDRLRVGGWTVTRSKVERKPTPATSYYSTRYARAKE